MSNWGELKQIKKKKAGSCFSKCQQISRTTDRSLKGPVTNANADLNPDDTVHTFYRLNRPVEQKRPLHSWFNNIPHLGKKICLRFYQLEVCVWKWNSIWWLVMKSCQLEHLRRSLRLSTDQTSIPSQSVGHMSVSWQRWRFRLGPELISNLIYLQNLVSCLEWICQNLVISCSCFLSLFGFPTCLPHLCLVSPQPISSWRSLLCSHLCLPFQLRLSVMYSYI